MGDQLDLFGMPAPDPEPGVIELDHLLEYVADGPAKETQWCFLDTAPPELRAPGGAVLCVEGTLVPHKDAAVKAQAAWVALDRWEAARAARLVPGR